MQTFISLYVYSIILLANIHGVPFFGETLFLALYIHLITKTTLQYKCNDYVQMKNLRLRVK